MIPLAVVAAHKAAYRATKNDSIFVLKEVYDHIMEDDYDGIDWFQNNMDFKDVKDFVFNYADHDKSESEETFDYDEDFEITEIQSKEVDM